MTAVKILVSSNFSLNTESFLFPLIHNRKLLGELGIKFKIGYEKTLENITGDVLIVTSKFISQLDLWKIEREEELFNFLRICRKESGKLIWVDLSDSSGTTQFKVLPFVDLYLKNAVLVNKSNYLRKMYGGRLFTDYYHNSFSINDDNEGEEHLNFIPEPQELNKVKVGWNSAYNNYNYPGYLYSKLRKYSYRMPFVIFNGYYPFNAEKKYGLNYRFNHNYKRNTVAYQRKQILKLLSGNNSIEYFSRKRYYNELSNTSVVISPFGWGEICYRDFETFYHGAALLKPSCDHFTTYPDLYQSDNSYIPFRWDLTDLEEKIHLLLDNQSERDRIAENGQKIYLHYLLTEVGKNEFNQRFLQLIQ